MANEQEVKASNARDLQRIGASLQALANLGEEAYGLEGLGREGAQLKAAAVTILQNFEATIVQRLRPRIDALAQTLAEAPEAFSTDQPDDGPAQV